MTPIEWTPIAEFEARLTGLLDVLHEAARSKWWSSPVASLNSPKIIDVAVASADEAAARRRWLYSERSRRSRGCEVNEDQVAEDEYWLLHSGRALEEYLARSLAARAWHPTGVWLAGYQSLRVARPLRETIYACLAVLDGSDTADAPPAAIDEIVWQALTGVTRMQHMRPANVRALQRIVKSRPSALTERCRDFAAFYLQLHVDRGHDVPDEAAGPVGDRE